MSIEYFFRHPANIPKALVMKLCYVVPEWIYIRLLYFVHLKKRLNLKHPRSFQEKLQWLKLYDRRDLYTIMVDKVKVKEYVANVLGEGYVIPMLKVWNCVEDIDFDELPNQFVLKTNAGGGGSGVVICSDKRRLNRARTKARLNKDLSSDLGSLLCEWPYKNVERKVFAERLMKDDNGADLVDYKFYCFNGKALYCQVIQDRSTKESIDFFDRKWVHQPFCGLTPGIRNSENLIPKPSRYDEMLEVADKLSAGIPFVRVDLFFINGCVYFGEMTFYPMSGMGRFRPEEWNDIFGDLIDLPSL